MENKSNTTSQLHTGIWFGICYFLWGSGCVHKPISKGVRRWETRVPTRSTALFRKTSGNVWLSCSSLAGGGASRCLKKADVLTSADPNVSVQWTSEEMLCSSANPLFKPWKDPPSYRCLGSLVQPYLPDIVSLKVRLEVCCSVLDGARKNTFCCLALINRRDVRQRGSVQFSMIYISKLLNCRN